MSFPCFAGTIEDDYDKRIKTLNNIREEVLDGTIPVYFSVSCEDKFINDKLKSRFSSELRKKDGVKIVYEREKAFLWINVLAIKANKNSIAVSVIYGRDVDCNVWREYHSMSDIKYSFPENKIHNTGHMIFTYNIKDFNELVSYAVDSFDANAVEDVRQERSQYIELRKTLNLK